VYLVFLALKVYQNLGCGREFLISFVNHYAVYFYCKMICSTVVSGDMDEILEKRKKTGEEIIYALTLQSQL
jgi:hypothetical protein